MVNSNIKDIGGFIYFSKNTQGQCGKPVKIHTNLLTDFLLAIDPDSASGQAVISNIESLKALAKPRGVSTKSRIYQDAYSKKHIAQLEKVNQHLAAMSQNYENSLITQNVRVFYHLDQRPGDTVQTVYINEVQMVGQSQDPGGLYEVITSRLNKTGLKKTSKANLDNKTVFISGLSDNVLDTRKTALANDKTCSAIFYIPDTVASNLTIGKDNRETEDFGKLVNELNETISSNQSRKVNWIIEGEGAALVQKTLSDPTNSSSLSNHKFSFLNPVGNIPKLMEDLSRRKANVSQEDIIKINYTKDPSKVGSTIASSISLGINGKQIVNQISSFPTSTSDCVVDKFMSKLRRESTKQAITNISENKTLQNLTKLGESHRGATKTFVDVLSETRRKFGA